MNEIKNKQIDNIWSILSNWNQIITTFRIPHYLLEIMFKYIFIQISLDENRMKTSLNEKNDKNLKYKATISEDFINFSDESVKTYVIVFKITDVSPTVQTMIRTAEFYLGISTEDEILSTDVISINPLNERWPTHELLSDDEISTNTLKVLSSNRLNERWQCDDKITIRISSNGVCEYRYNNCPFKVFTTLDTSKSYLIYCLVDAINFNKNEKDPKRCIIIYDYYIKG